MPNNDDDDDVCISDTTDLVLKEFNSDGINVQSERDFRFTGTDVTLGVGRVQHAGHEQLLALIGTTVQIHLDIQTDIDRDTDKHTDTYRERHRETDIVAGVSWV